MCVRWRNIFEMILMVIGSVLLMYGDFVLVVVENMKNGWLYCILDKLFIMIFECFDGDLVICFIFG